MYFSHRNIDLIVTGIEAIEIPKLIALMISLFDLESFG